MSRALNVIDYAERCLLDIGVVLRLCKVMQNGLLVLATCRFP